MQLDDDGMSLLQFRATAHNVADIRRVSQGRALEDPGAAERAMCPHELEAEEEAGGDTAFGCDGTLKAPDTVKCSFWGEPHITDFFTGTVTGQKGMWGAAYYDVFYKPGLWKLGAAADGSWEIQTFNCGSFAQSVAIRLGKTIIEVIGGSSIAKGGREDKEHTVYVNGKLEGLPFQIGNVRLGETSLHSSKGMGEVEKKRMPGTCIDYGGLSIDLTTTSQGNEGWVGLLIEAASDSVTTIETDPNAICNLRWNGIDTRNHNWPVQEVPPEKSLFTRGDEICSECFRASFANPGSCDKMQPVDADSVRLERVCASQNIALADAASACEHLANNEGFFQDCQLDFCWSDGDDTAVEVAEAEEVRENPQPLCLGGGDDCNPGTACCNALRDQAKLILDNVVTNNICGTEDGDQQLRFGRALTQNGVSMDLVVNPVGEYACGPRVTNDKFGSKNAEIGLLALAAGTEATFEFRFVKAGTSDPVDAQSVMLSFLDIDQGKKNRQRESIQVCGGGVVVTDDNELDVVENGGCTTVTSTTHGTGRDNPTSVEGMSQIQRARSAAFFVQGSSFQAKFSVSKKGRNGRKFMFAGHPGVACVLKR